MIDNADMIAIRDALATRREGGDFSQHTMTLTLLPRAVRVDAVSQDGEQVFVRYDDGTAECLRRSEIGALAE